MVDVDATRDVPPAMSEVDIFVTVGTDHHPFDRLIDWVEQYAAQKGRDGAPVAVVYQYGTSRQPEGGRSADYLDHEELRSLMSRSRAVVSHGGPATITDAFSAGRRPVVVPRDPALGEHVDGHQLSFASFLADRDEVDLGRSPDEMTALLDEILRSETPVTRPQTTHEDAARRLGEEVLARRPKSAGRTLRIVIPTSGGGHLAQCWRLMPFLREHDRTWVSADAVDVASVLRDEEVRVGHFPTTRNLPNLVRNTLLALRVMVTVRPDVVVSTGAGVAVPYFWLARLTRSTTVYLEVYDRIDSTTMTGRLVRPVTDLFFVQWPEQQRLYRGSRLLGRVL